MERAFLAPSTYSIVTSSPKELSTRAVPLRTSAPVPELISEGMRGVASPPKTSGQTGTAEELSSSEMDGQVWITALYLRKTNKA